MELKIDPKKLHDDALFKNEERLKSRTVEFIQNASATYVTYYNLNQELSTVDRTLHSVANYSGKNSPNRYNKILNFQLFNSETPTAEDDIGSGIQAISSNGNAICLSSTITPTSEDLFVFEYMGQTALFRIDKIRYDNMRINSWFELTYSLVSTSPVRIKEIEEQVVEVYEQSLYNDSLVEKRILRTDTVSKIESIKELIKQLSELYIAQFYNKKYQCFLYNSKKFKCLLYNPCGEMFMKYIDMFSQLSNTKIINLRSFENYEPRLDLFYVFSPYHWIQDKVKNTYEQFTFHVSGVVPFYQNTDLSFWGDSIGVIIPSKECPRDCGHFFPPDFVEALSIEHTKYIGLPQIISKYINNKLTIDDIANHTNMSNILRKADPSFNDFIQIPILIYILIDLLKSYKESKHYTI